MFSVTRDFGIWHVGERPLGRWGFGQALSNFSSSWWSIWSAMEDPSKLPPELRKLLNRCGSSGVLKFYWSHWKRDAATCSASWNTEDKTMACWLTHFLWAKALCWHWEQPSILLCRCRRPGLPLRLQSHPFSPSAFHIGRLFFYRGPHRDLKQVSSVRLRSQNKDEQGIYHFNPFHTCTIMYHHVPTCINLLRVNDSICDAALYSQNKATPIVRAMRSYRIETRRSRMRRSNSCPLLAPFSCRVVGLLQRTRCCHKFMERERERKIFLYINAT